MDLKEMIDCNGHVSIPNGVTRIDNEAFYGCTELSSIFVHITKKSPDESRKFINSVLDCFDSNKVILCVPIGTGYAYEHFPFKKSLKEVVIDK